MTITITAAGEFIASGEQPEIGKSYILEPADSGTGAQNRAFHALVGEYWKSGCGSYPAGSYDDFRNCIKRSLGAGFESYAYADIVDGMPVLQVVKTFEEVPKWMRDDHRMKSMVRGRLKSWSDYTKKERRETMDKLIAEMHLVGVQSKKFHEILAGMEGIWG